MRIYILASIILLAACAGTAAPARAQSLADVARKEEARRKATTAAGKTYTNDDLLPVQAPVPPPAAAQPSGTADAATPAPGASSEPPADAAKADSDTPADPAATSPARDEAYWKKRMVGLREQLERNTSYAEAMQTRINALTTDFTNRDDPAQRARIGVDRQKALADLDRLKKTIEDDKKAIANLEEEARRGSVPAGWLR